MSYSSRSVERAVYRKFFLTRTVCVCKLLIAVVSGSITMGMVFVYYARLLFSPQICLFLLDHSKQSH